MADRDGAEESGGPDSDGPERAGGTDLGGPTAGDVDGPGRREVEVPLELYKVVTVFSTLLSVLFVVLGFGVMSMATTVVRNPPASPVVGLLTLLGVPMGRLEPHLSTLALAVGLVGLALVAVGAGIYVYGSRFRAPGMGKPKDEADEPADDG